MFPSPKPAYQPISLPDLVHRLKKSDDRKSGDTCIGFPFPSGKRCRQPVMLEDQLRQQAHTLLHSVLANGQLPPRDCVQSLLDTANDLFCEKHVEYAIIFVHRWLAEIILPKIIRNTKWEPNTLTRICLGSQEGETCNILQIRQHMVNFNRYRSSLGASTVGEDKYMEGAFRQLMEYCLCEGHKLEAAKYARELFSRFKDMLDAPSIMNIEDGGKKESIGDHDIEQSRVRRKNSDKTSTNDEVGGSHEGNLLVNLADDDPGDIPTPSRRQLQSMPARESPTGKAPSNRSTSPAKDRPPEVDPFVDDNSYFFTRNQDLSTAKCRPGSGSSQSPLNPTIPRFFGNTQALSPSSTVSRGRRTSPARPHESSLVSQEIPSDCTNSDIGSELASHNSSPSTANTKPLSAAHSTSPSGLCGKRTISQGVGTGDTPNKPLKKQRRTSAQRMNITGSDEIDEEMPDSLDFKPFYSEKEKEEKEEKVGTTINKIFHKMKRKISSAESQRATHGYIYIFRIVGRPGYVKIGVTEGPIERRLKQVQSCTKFKLEVLGQSSPTLIRYYERAEKLIHMDLRNKRHFFECKCKQEKAVHSSEANDGLTKHGEWFAVSESEAEKVVEKWKGLMHLEPYNEDGELKLDWKTRIKNCQTHPGYFKETVPAEEKNDERWKSFMNGYYDHSLFRQVFLDARPKTDNRPARPSRWVLMKDNWKDNALFWLTHSLLSLGLCYCAGYCSVGLSLVLCALFSLTSICYAL